MKKALKTEQSQQKILQSAFSELTYVRYEQFSLTTLCTKHHISKGLLYHNFANKDELYLCCVWQTFQAILHHLREQPTHGLSLEQCIHTFLQFRQNFLQENPQYQLIFSQVLLFPPNHLKESLLPIQVMYNQFVRDRFHTYIQQVHLRDGLTKERAIDYLCLIQTLYISHFQNQAIDTPINQHDLAIQQALDLFINGIV